MRRSVCFSDCVGRVTSWWQTVLSYNTGVTFGLGAAASGWIISLLTAAVIAWLVRTLLRTPRGELLRSFALSIIVGGAAGMLFCGLMTWKGLAMAYTAWEHNDRMSTTLGTPLTIPYLFLPVGFGLLGLTYAARLVSSLAGQCRKKDPGGPAPDAGQKI